jgi:hypothetical protein
VRRPRPGRSRARAAGPDRFPARSPRSGREPPAPTAFRPGAPVRAAGREPPAPSAFRRPGPGRWRRRFPGRSPVPDLVSALPWPPSRSGPLARSAFMVTFAPPGSNGVCGGHLAIRPCSAVGGRSCTERGQAPSRAETRRAGRQPSLLQSVTSLGRKSGHLAAESRGRGRITPPGRKSGQLAGGEGRRPRAGRREGRRPRAGRREGRRPRSGRWEGRRQPVAVGEGPAA